jgi:hypothetical protein
MQYNKKTRTLIIYNYDEKISIIPNEVENVIFQVHDYYKITFIPQNIIQLTINSVFNAIFKNKLICLPKNLTHLTFGENFNKKVDNLPKNLTHLTVGENFNKKVDNLPKYQYMSNKDFYI